MITRFDFRGSIDRRGFLGMTAAAGALAFLGHQVPCVAALADSAASAAKPNSLINGVRIGCITYSYRGGINTAEDTLKALVQDGLSETELMDGPIRAFAGIRGGGGPRGRRGPG